MKTHYGFYLRDLLLVEGLYSSYLGVVSVENLVTSTIVPEEWDTNISKQVQQVFRYRLSIVTAHMLFLRMQLCTLCFAVTNGVHYFPIV